MSRGVTLACTAGLVLLVVPGIWIGLRLSWAPYLFMDERLGATDALRESFRRTRGHALSLLWLWTIGGAVILASHLGRPKGVTPEFSLAPVAKHLSECLRKSIAQFQRLHFLPLKCQALQQRHNSDP